MTPIIGLEIHVRLKTKTKMFCSCLNDSVEHHPNVNICPICAGHPGTLPTINKQAVAEVLKVGFALHSQIADISKFDRKNYFYPDLPKGYQISQYDKPFCVGGILEIDGKKVRIRRVHLEEDAGKLVHDETSGASLVDLNRAGTPLMELVTEPDMRSAEKAKKFCEELQIILRYLDVSNADMENGEMRCEANISLAGEDGRFGTKVEVKNLNSFKAVERAIEYEIERQENLLSAGKNITQETRGWDENKGETFSQRSKEEAHDYRYFPEPDLPMIDVPKFFDLEKIKLSVPELPNEKRLRFARNYELSVTDIDILTKDRYLAAFFENVVSELKGDGRPAKTAANYIVSDLMAHMKEKDTPINEILITPEDFAELIVLIHADKISSAAAKSTLKEMFSTGKDPSQIIEEKGLLQVSNIDEIGKIAQNIINANPGPASDFKAGKQNALQFLIGQAMKETKGKAKPDLLAKIFIEKLLN